MTTLMQILQETQVSGSLLPPDTARRRKLQQATGNPAYLPSWLVDQENWRQKMLAAGFAWIVQPKFVERFRYAAGVSILSHSWGQQGRSAVYGTGSGDSLLYVGDIPDFALEKIEQAKSIGILFITIHSCQPLPVQRVHLISLDPVLVGWQYHPDIRGRFLGGFSCHSKDVLGVVLAAWDLDKEIDL